MADNLNKTISKSFYMMFFGLFISGLTAWVTYTSNAFETILTNNMFNTLMIIELGVVIVFSWCFKKLQPNTVKLLYFIYALINGLSLSVIFAVFELNSIISIFFITAFAFGVLAYIGKNTNTDLTKFSTYLSIFLISGFILNLLNLFIFKNSMFEIILDWIMLIVFFGVTISDINRAKYLSYDIEDDKLYIYLAMDLYLDFVNIFIRILSLFGKHKD